MTIAKGLSSGYQPMVVMSVMRLPRSSQGTGSSRLHLFSHPVAAAVANENLRIMEEENIVGYVRETAAPI